MGAGTTSCGQHWPGSTVPCAGQADTATLSAGEGSELTQVWVHWALAGCPVSVFAVLLQLFL